MAFIPIENLPKDFLVGKSVKLNRPFRNMAGLFEKNTVMQCVEVTVRGGIILKDEEGHRLLMNKSELAISAVVL